MSDENSNEMKDKSDVTNISSATSKETSKEVAASNKVAPLTNDELATLDYKDFSTPARMLALASVLVKSQLVPLKTPEDVMMALMTGKELGLPFITSVSQIYPINGRPTLGVHIQKAILLKNGIIFNKIENAVDIFRFVEADKDGKPKVIVKEGNVKTYVDVGIGTLEEQPKNTCKSKFTVRTTYEFTRSIKMASGNFKDMTIKSSFTIQEANEAELLDKDVWKKYWRRMLDARAFTIGAREIADDLLLGMMSPNELSSDFYINEQGEDVHVASIVEEEEK